MTTIDFLILWQITATGLGLFYTPPQMWLFNVVTLVGLIYHRMENSNR